MRVHTCIQRRTQREGSDQNNYPYARNHCATKHAPRANSSSRWVLAGESKTMRSVIFGVYLVGLLGLFACYVVVCFVPSRVRPVCQLDFPCCKEAKAATDSQSSSLQPQLKKEQRGEKAIIT
jgi:hypothetical protein